MSEISNLSLYQKYPNLILPIRIMCDQQIKNTLSERDRTNTILILINLHSNKMVDTHCPQLFPIKSILRVHMSYGFGLVLLMKIYETSKSFLISA